MDTMFVRLKPYAPQHGVLVKRYHCLDNLYSIDNETGRPLWYAIADPALLAHLSKLTQQENEPMSPPLFDIVDEEAHAAICAEEENLRLVKLGIMSPTMVRAVANATTIDRTKSTVAGRAAAVPEPELNAPSPLEYGSNLPDPKDLQPEGAGDLQMSDLKPVVSSVVPQIPYMAPAPIPVSAPIAVVAESPDVDMTEAVAAVPTPEPVRPRRRRGKGKNKSS